MRHNLQLAEHLYQCGEFTRAAEVYLAIAAAYARHGHVEEATAICYRILHVDPRRFVLDAEVADTLQRLGRRAAPIAATAAEIHFAAGNGSDAVSLALFAADIDGRDPVRYVRAAEMLLARQQYPEAIAQLTQAGRRLLADNRHAEYVNLARQILSIDAFHAPTLRDLARTHVILGDPHAAVSRLAALMKASPEDPTGYEILAQAFATIGRVPKTLAILTRLVHDLRRDEREDAALDLLNRAKWWRRDDHAFQGALVALRTPPPAVDAATSSQPAPPREQTVMLSIDDIMTEIEPERDLEGTLILAIEDIAFVEASRRTPRRRRQPTPPPLPRSKAALPPPPPGRGAPRRGRGRPVGREDTAILQLSDLIFAEPVVRDAAPELPALLVDEESGLLPLAALRAEADTNVEAESDTESESPPETEPMVVDDDATTVSRRRPTAPVRRGAPPPVRTGPVQPPTARRGPPPPPAPDRK